MPIELFYYIVIAIFISGALIVWGYVSSDAFTLQDLFYTVLAGLLWPVTVFVAVCAIAENAENIVLKKERKRKDE